MTLKTTRIRSLSGTGLIVLFIALACALPAASDSPPAEDVNITVINPQSYPAVGGNWTVLFNTSGKADLIITAVNGTEFNKDLEFIEVRCGDEIMNHELINNSILIRDYECNGTGAETSKVLSAGKHHLEFRFGGDVEYAHNEGGWGGQLPPGFIIPITAALHLDANTTKISDVFEDVKGRDNVWSEPVYDGEYVRVRFEKNLTPENDITIYARNVQGLNTTVEVYYYNSTEKITEFPIISETNYYKIYLTGMIGSHDTFDLKIKNYDNDSPAYLEFDYIVDPTSTVCTDGVCVVTFTTTNASWPLPAGVTSVNVVAVGGGGGGTASANDGSGGGGGGLGWKNNILVTPGVYNVVVGTGGSRGGASASGGGNSYFIDVGTVAGLGGAGAVSTETGGAGGGHAGDGGGDGGRGGNGGGSNADAGGGGGAGGYSGNGGQGGDRNTAGSAGAGGGAGGGGAGGDNDAAGGGGGVGPYGQGASGTAGTLGGGNGGGGGGGSGGANGVNGDNPQGDGGLYGGGGGGADNTNNEHGNGAAGVVVITYLEPAVNWNQSTLNLGSGYKGAGSVNGSANIIAIGNNTNVTVNCTSGSCGTISLISWSNSTNLTDTSIQANFTCKDSTLGNFWANFSVKSSQDTTLAYINVSCAISSVVSWNQPTLNLGSGPINAGNLTGNANLTSLGNNTNVTVKCSSSPGNCSAITFSWSNVTNMSHTESRQVNFTCVNSTVGNFSAVFNVTSVEDTTPVNITVTCEIQPADNTPPVVKSISPANNTNTTNQNVVFYYNVSDTSNIANCTIYLYNSSGGLYKNVTSTAVTKDVTQSFTPVISTDGIYSWYVNCTDVVRNVNSSETRYIKVDTTPPNYSNISDTSGGTVLEGTTVNVSVYWQDALSNLGAAVFYHNASGSFVLNSTCDLSAAKTGWCNATIDTTGMTDRRVCWYQNANDSLGNLNDTMFSSNLSCFNVVTQPSLSLTKGAGLVDNADAEIGGYVNFTIIIKNTGTGNMYNISLFDYLPPWFNYTGSWLVNSSGTYPIGSGNVTTAGSLSSGLNVTWNMSWYNDATLAIGENFTIISGAQVMSNASMLLNTNTACANGTNLIGNSTGAVCDSAYVWVYYPDIAVTKTGNVTEAKPGESVEYTIVIYNRRSSTAYNVSISDELQYGFKLTSNGTLTLWNDTVINITTIETLNETSPEAGSTIHWNYTINLSSLQYVTLKYNTTVTSDAKCGLNVVRVNYSDQSGTQMPQSIGIWKVCPILRGVLTIDKLAIDSLVYPGNDATYEVIISNSGDAPLYDVVITDTPPDGWEYVEGSIINLTESVCNVTRTGSNFTLTTNLSAESVCIFRYDLHVPELTCFGEYYNSISGISYDSNGTAVNSSSYASIDVIPQVILEVRKNVNGSLYYAHSDIIDFTITVSSKGNTTVYNITLNDTLPYGLDLLNVTWVNLTGGTQSGTNLPVSLGNITGGSQITAHVYANVTGSTFEGVNVNEVTVSGEGPCGTVVTSGDAVSFVVGVPELYVYKSQEKGSIQPGEQNKYNITVTNTGTGTAYNINITDTLTGLTYVANSSYLNGNLVGDPVNLSNKLIWNSTNLNNTNLTSGETAVLVFNLTANLSSGCGVDMGMDEAYANASDGLGNIVSNTYSVGTQIIHPFIEVTKYANVTRAEAGDLVQYVITVRNPSSATAYNVTVTDVLQEGFVNRSGGSPAPSGYDDATGTLTWESFNLSGNNATTIISYAAMVTPNATAPPGVNRVTASAVDGGGCALVNATDAWGVIVFHPAVQARKNVNISVAQPGDVLEYEISVYNPSEAKAYNVSVYEFNQTGFYPTSWTGEVYELYRVGFREWLKYIGTVNIYNVTVNVSGDNVSALYFNLSNTTSSTGTIVNGTLIPYGGITIKFNMTAGKDAVTGYDEAWALGYYYDGATRASIDFDREYVIINHPYLDIEKSTIPETLGTAKPGDTVTYQIRIVNPDSGPVASMADARIWGVMDEMQDGYVLTSNGTGTVIPAGGSYTLTADSTTGLIKFTPESPVILSPGQELIFNFTTRVNSSADFDGCNIASYNATDNANGPILTQYSQTCLTILKPNANINKISNRQASEPGGIVEFTLILENDGNSPLYNVTINDTITSGWEFIETTQNITGMTITPNSTGSATNNTVIFGGITLNEGQRSIIKYTSRVTDSVTEGSSENCANITGYDNSTYSYSDGYCMEIKVYKPSLEVVKDVSQHDVEPGSEPMVTIIIQNPTYATVYNITVTEFMPRGFNYTAGSAKLDGVPIDDPNITGTGTFDCGSTTTGQLNLTWNLTYAGALSGIPPKTIKVLTFKVHVKCNVQNDIFNNTVNVSGVNGAGGAVGPESTFFEMKGYLADAELYKYASNNAPTYFEYVDYKIVIWNNPAGANIAPLTLADVMPPYLKYVPGYTYVGDLKLEPAVCGDYTDKTTNDTITNVRNDSGGVNCTGFNGTLMDAAGTKFNAAETEGDGKGQILLWNLSKWLFLTPGQQVSIKYRTQVIPGIGGIAQNNATLSYLDPEHPELCMDCVFDLSISRTIAVNPPAGWTDTKDVNYTLKLKKGWNLISLPVTPENTTLAAVTSPIEGKYVDVAAWDGGWVYRSYAYGDWFGTLDSIEPKKGYWLNMKEDADLKVRGQSINAFNITLHGGWNLIGWPSTQAMPVENLTVEYVDLATWDGVWIYRSYAYGDWFGDLSSIEPGRGYWLNIAGTSELSAG